MDSYADNCRHDYFNVDLVIGRKSLDTSSNNKSVVTLLHGWSMVQCNKKWVLKSRSHSEECDVKGSQHQQVEFSSSDVTNIMTTRDSSLQLTLDTCLSTNGNKALSQKHLTITPQESSQEANDRVCRGIATQVLRGQLTTSKRTSSKVVDSNKKAALVIVNPKSGVQRAQDIYRKFALPILEKQSRDFDYLVTSRANHARMYVSGFPDLTGEYDLVVIVSGDGLMHEVYQGLASRPDWSDAFRIPVTMVPGGSGNAMAKCVLHFRSKTSGTGNNDPSSSIPDPITQRNNYIQACVDCALTGTVSPMDLVRVRTGQISSEAEEETVTSSSPNEVKTVTSFMSFGMGILSDIDIESESLRMLGQIRFAIFAVIRGLFIKRYKVRVSYVRRGETAWTVDDDDEFVLVQCLTKPWMAETLLVAPQLKSFSDGVIWLILVRKNVARKSLFSWMFQQERGILTQFPHVSAIPVTAVRIEPLTSGSGNGVNGHMTVDGEVMDYGPLEAHILPGCANTLIYNNNCSKSSSK